MKTLACIFSFHRWKHSEIVKTQSQTITTGKITLTLGSRNFYYRECERCRKFAQYYPSNIKQEKK